jgi:plasmid stability protein
MDDIVVRGLDAQTIATLRDRAIHHGRSLEDEAREILQQAAPVSNEGLMPLREDWKNLPEIATRLRALRQQSAWKDVPIRSLIDEGRRF